MLRRPFTQILLLCCLFVLSSCVSTGPSQDVDEDALRIKRANLHLQIAMDALRKNNLPKAFDELMKAEKSDPKRAIITATLAYAWKLRGDLKRAESTYKRALRKGKESSIYTNYGNLLIEMKQYTKAEKQLRKALNDPRYNKQDIAYINLGDALAGQNKMHEAIDAYRQASIINPNQKLSLIKEAEVYVQFGRLNFAQALYESILRENRTNKRALQGLIKLLHQRHDTGNIKKHLKLYQKHTSSPLEHAWASDELEHLE